MPNVGVAQVVNGNNNYVVGTNEHRFVYTVRALGTRTWQTPANSQPSCFPVCPRVLSGASRLLRGRRCQRAPAGAQGLTGPGTALQVDSNSTTKKKKKATTGDDVVLLGATAAPTTSPSTAASVTGVTAGSGSTGTTSQSVIAQTAYVPAEGAASSIAAGTNTGTLLGSGSVLPAATAGSNTGALDGGAGGMGGSAAAGIAAGSSAATTAPTAAPTTAPKVNTEAALIGSGSMVQAGQAVAMSVGTNTGSLTAVTKAGGDNRGTAWASAGRRLLREA